MPRLSSESEAEPSPPSMSQSSVNGRRLARTVQRWSSGSPRSLASQPTASVSRRQQRKSSALRVVLRGSRRRLSPPFVYRFDDYARLGASVGPGGQLDALQP